MVHDQITALIQLEEVCPCTCNPGGGGGGGGGEGLSFERDGDARRLA